MRALLLLALLSACGGDDAPGGPGAADIDFTAGEPLPAGAWLIYNDWAPTPNPALVLPIDDLGGVPTTLFTANRVWSMGAAGDGSTIYFSAWDAAQELHFGITIGDAIQNSFRYDPASGELRALSWGNINDECQAPGVDGYLYFCRRYGFTPEGAFNGWRLARLPIGGGDVEFLRPDDPGGPFELTPQLLPDGITLLFELRERSPATGNWIFTRDLGTGDEVMIRADAGRPLLAPDGHHYLFQDRTALSTYFEADLDDPGAEPLPVTATSGAGSATWSPAGDAVVYTVFDDTMSCDHLERVDFDGQAWSSPVRLRDCADTGEFITEIAWVVVP
jgi:hypothetical protein